MNWLNGLFVLGVCLLLATTLIYAYDFFLAWRSPSKRVTIDVDSVGEANLEFGILAFVIPLGFFVLFHAASIAPPW